MFQKNWQTFEEYIDITDKTRQPLGVALGISESMIADASVLDVTVWAETLTCKYFEGHQMDLSAFDDKTWSMLYETMPRYFGDSLQSDMRQLYCAKLIYIPMSILKHKVDRMRGEAS